MHRRRFLTTAVLASCAMPAARNAKPIRIGFLGAAHAHASHKVEICGNSPDWELVGVWEPDAAIAKRYRARQVPMVVRPEDLLKDRSIAVIAVESEVRHHARYARMALEAGKHVHVEKPPATDWNGIESIVGLARRKNLKLQSGYMWRHHPGFHRIFEAVRNGWLGHVYLVRGEISTLLNAQSRKETAEFRGGHMFELCSHLVDALIRLMGRPRKVTPFLQNVAGPGDTLNDNTIAVFEFDRAMGLIHGASMQPSAQQYRGFEVLGVNGTATLRPLEGAPRLELNLAAAAGPYRKGRQVVELPAYERYVGDFAELAAAVRTGKPLGVTLDEELAVQEALLRASGMFV